ncbi:hypothetical protein [Gloeobacter kilaueensis]|uniref:Uncharacterized protein n=1 Tax=Gloeobacter kilaueensis (strain ATCC BAA-2537 / CCAP 1431/1 / ULC 316 / JS1) TaxID=1183438 RepID=U5QK95_GLOK1|nr:hypothetical protein [Gloeobacter kilaueensis]AGY59316.1 hypothetical protein GKIL_3070 [Gloeobacter kilaueensis JS1]
MLQRLRELRSRYFGDLDSALIEPQPRPSGEATLTDTNAVDTEAELAAAAESVDPEVREAVLDLYQRCLERYEYVKEANEKFLAMLDEGLLTDLTGSDEQQRIRAFAENLTLDPIDQPMHYASYEEEDIVDEAQGLIDKETILFGDDDNLDNRSERT